MKKLFALILLTIFVNSCGDNGTNPTDTSVLMPLKIGNSWEYIDCIYHSDNKIETIEYTLNIDSQIEVNNQTYFQLNLINSQSNNIYFVKSYHQNKQDGHYILYDLDDLNSMNFLKYPTIRQELIYQNEWQKFFTEDVDAIIEVKAGKFKCIKYVLNSYNDYNVLYKILNFYYSPGVGLILNEVLDLDKEKGIFKLAMKTELKSYKLN